MPKTSKRAIQAPPTDSLDYGRKRSQWRDVLHRLTRNKLAMLGLVIVLVLVLAAVFADFVAPYDPDVQDYTNMKAYPSFAHPLGTDDVARRRGALRRASPPAGSCCSGHCSCRSPSRMHGRAYRWSSGC